MLLLSQSTRWCVYVCHRELLQRDEAILRQLLQQELKKRESLRAAEGKVAKLREQLQASEKIVGANKTLLRKLQEQVSVQPPGPVTLWTSTALSPPGFYLTCGPPLQVQRVEHRVSMKKSLAVRLEQELTHAQLMAGRGSKRRTGSAQTLVSLQHFFTCCLFLCSSLWAECY